MMNLHCSRFAFAAVFATGTLLCSTAWGATQVLDRVVGVGPGATRQMAFDVPPQARTADSIPYYTVPTSTEGFIACQASSKGGVVCVDGPDVREWKTPARSQSPNTGELLFSCSDLGFSSRKGSSGCTGLALQPDAIWVTGRKSNNLYSLVKAVPKGASCPADSTVLPGDKYCLVDYDFATGRPLLQELNALDDELASEYVHGEGVYGVELRSAIYFYPDTNPASQPVPIGENKKALGLSGSEQALSVTLVKLASDEFVYLYVTTTGRVLMLNDQRKVPVKVFDMVEDRAGSPPPANCPASSADDFGLTVSKFGRIYASDKRYCRVVALETAADSSNVYGFKLQNVIETNSITSVSRELTLSTGTVAPESVSVAPGVVLNLADCVGPCTYVGGTDEKGNSTAGAKMSNIQLQDNGKTYMTVYKVEGIPDCRYIDATDDRCKGKGSVIGSTTGWQQLDVSKLLPEEITDLFPDQLPPMLISPQWHADPDKEFVFDALFGITEPGLEFKGVGSGEVFVRELTGDERGCVDPALGSTGLPLETVGSQRGLLELDISTTVSENYVSYTNGDVGHLDTIINSGCGSTRQVIVSWSLKPVDLVMNRNTVHRNIFDPTQPGLYFTENDDAVFAKLVDTLYDDLKRVLDNQVCDAPPEVLQPPLTGSVCSSLKSTWDNGRDKLNKCLSATTQPKQSAGDQNCSAFGSQLMNFIATAQSAPAALPGLDPANRIGELQGRAKVIEYLLNYRFLPSIPAEGFCEDPNLKVRNEDDELVSVCRMSPYP